MDEPAQEPPEQPITELDVTFDPDSPQASYERAAQARLQRRREDYPVFWYH